MKEKNYKKKNWKTWKNIIKKKFLRTENFKNFFWMGKKSVRGGSDGIDRGNRPRWVRKTWFRGEKMRVEKVFFMISIFYSIFIDFLLKKKFIRKIIEKTNYYEKVLEIMKKIMKKKYWVFIFWWEIFWDGKKIGQERIGGYI